MLDPRGRLLMAALGFAGCSMPSFDRALWALRTWLDSWPGIGHVAVGMHRQGFDLHKARHYKRGQLRQTRRAPTTTSDGDRPLHTLIDKSSLASAEYAACRRSRSQRARSLRLSAGLKDRVASEQLLNVALTQKEYKRRQAAHLR